MIRKIVIFLTVLTITLFIYIHFSSKKTTEKLIINEDEKYNSNLLENIRYVAKDADGNEYIINAKKGEIDLNNKDIIFLENVKSLIKLKNSNEINIKSKFGKYNVINYDTIFSKNVEITYLDNKITGEYLDFSILENRMIISRNIVFTNFENVLKADVIELNINNKDTKIYMYETDKEINVKSKNFSNGNN